MVTKKRRCRGADFAVSPLCCNPPAGAGRAGFTNHRRTEAVFLWYDVAIDAAVWKS